MEYHEDRHNRDRVKHVLKINAPTTEDLNSVFVCNARNKVGQIRKTIPIKGKTCVSVFLFLHLQLLLQNILMSPVQFLFILTKSNNLLFHSQIHITKESLDP